MYFGLAQAQATDTVVTLSSSSPSVRFVVGTTYVQSVTIAAGSTAARVGISYDPAYVQHDAVVRVSTPTDMRVFHIGVVPTGQQQPIANLTTYSMPGQVLLNWDCTLPSLSGVTYKIYKDVNGTRTLIKSGWRESFFSDTSASTASTRYYVEAVRTGYLIGSGPIVDAQVSAASGSTQVAATGVPTSTVSGSFSVNASGVSGAVFGTVVVDGQAVGSLKPYAPTNTLSGSAPVVVDTSLLSDGAHTLQLFVENAGVTVATPEYTFNSSNATRVQYNSGLSEPTAGYDAAFVASFAQPSSYQVDILNGNGSAIRSSSGYGARVDYFWDGNDSSGNDAESGSYTARLTANGTTKNIPLARMRGGPNFLALLQPVNGPSDTADTARTKQYANVIRSAVQQIQNNYGYYDAAIFVLTDDLINPAVGANLQRWMRNAKAFYYYGHMLMRPDLRYSNGIETFFQFGNVAVYPDFFSGGRRSSPFRFTVDTIVDPDNPYNFVFLDTCSSAGGAVYNTSNYGFDDKVGPLNIVWKTAFGSNCFVGWNGLSGSNSNTDGTDSYWFRYRSRFWSRMGQSDYISRAFGFANNAAPPYNLIMPQDQMNGQIRLYQDGDTTLP